MELVRYDPATAQPLPGGVNTFYQPLRIEDRMQAMLLVLDKRGDTGRREVPVNTLISIIAGEGNVRAGGTVAELRAGDMLMMPAGRAHQIWTTSSALQLVIVNLSG